MFKNLIIFILVVICSIQGYILYSNKDQGWLQQSIKQTKSKVENLVKPELKDSPNKPVASTTINQPAKDSPQSANEVSKSVKTTIKTTTTESFAFAHLSNNVDCSKTTNTIDQTICNDTDLLDQDKRLNFILNKWNKSTKKSDYPIAPQQSWLQTREKTCAQANEASIKSCIQKLTEKRIQAITGQI